MTGNPHTTARDLRAILTRPRHLQLTALNALRETLPALALDEAWNTRFGEGSLFDAWTRSSVVQGLYAANRARISAHLGGRAPVRIIEAGGGDGRLWMNLLPTHTQGEVVVIDPMAEPATLVGTHLPSGVQVTPRVQHVQDVEDWGHADLVVMSLTLHHVAGRDREERERHGLTGPGKLDVLQRACAALRQRHGMLLLNEADIFCELALSSGDPYLRDRLADSYIRRCMLSLLDDIDQRADADDDLRARWWAIARLWCLDQLDAADVDAKDRDVYELDVLEWESLLHRAGFSVAHRACTDAYGLFYQYVCTPQ